MDNHSLCSIIFPWKNSILNETLDEVMNLSGVSIFKMETAAMLVSETIGHFRVTCASVLKRILRKTFFMTTSLIWMKMNLQIKCIFITMVSHEDLSWHRAKATRKWPILWELNSFFLCKHFPLFQQICIAALWATWVETLFWMFHSSDVWRLLLSSATRNFFEFWLVHCNACGLCDWLERLL